MNVFETNHGYQVLDSIATSLQGLAEHRYTPSQGDSLKDFIDLVDYIQNHNIYNYTKLIDSLRQDKEPELLNAAINQYPEQIARYLDNHF